MTNEREPRLRWTLANGLTLLFSDDGTWLEFKVEGLVGTVRLESLGSGHITSRAIAGWCEKAREHALNAAETRAAQPGTPDALRTEIEELLEEIAGRAIDGNYAAPAREAYRTCGKSLAALLAAKPSSAPGAHPTLEPDTIVERCAQITRTLANKKRETYDFRRGCLESEKAILAVRGTFAVAAPAAAAPASTEAPGVLSADEIVERCAKFLEEYPDLGSFSESLSPKWVSENSTLMRDALSTAAEKMCEKLKGCFALPSTEALIAAGDVLLARLDAFVNDRVENYTDGDYRRGREAMAEWDTARDAAVAALHPASEETPKS